MKILMFYAAAPVMVMPDVLLSDIPSAFSRVPYAKAKKFVEKNVGKIHYEPYNGHRSTVVIDLYGYTSKAKKERQNEIINVIKETAKKNNIASTTIGCVSRRRFGLKKGMGK